MTSTIRASTHSEGVRWKLTRGGVLGRPLVGWLVVVGGWGSALLRFRTCVPGIVIQLLSFVAMRLRVGFATHGVAVVPGTNTRRLL